MYTGGIPLIGVPGFGKILKDDDQTFQYLHAEKSTDFLPTCDIGYHRRTNIKRLSIIEVTYFFLALKNQECELIFT
jgi:hypothetical protein